MAYSEYIAERIRPLLDKAGKIEEKRMMGGLVFMVNDKMCLGLDQDKNTGKDRLMVRVGKLPYEALLQREGSKPMDFTGKVMRGFLFIDPVGFDRQEDLEFWVAKSLEFNQMIGG